MYGGHVSQSLDFGRMGADRKTIAPSSRHGTQRPTSRYSRVSARSNYDDETISIAAKRKKTTLPKLNIDRKDTDYVNLLSENFR